MSRRNSNKKMRNNKVMSSNQKLKSDFINYYDYIDLFHTEYNLIDKENRKNLEQISKSLCEITIAKGDN